MITWGVSGCEGFMQFIFKICGNGDPGNFTIFCLDINLVLYSRLIEVSFILGNLLCSEKLLFGFSRVSTKFLLHLFHLFYLGQFLLLFFQDLYLLLSSRVNLRLQNVRFCTCCRDPSLLNGGYYFS